MTPLASAIYTILDTETTGTEDGAELLEIAAERFGPDEESTAFETLVKPAGPIPPEAKGVHHIVEADVVDAPAADVARAQLAAFVDGVDVLVAHNAEYDRGFLPELADRKWLCTERLAHHLVPDAPNFKLGTLYYYLGGDKIMATLHRAASDLRPLQYVLAVLMQKYEQTARQIVGDDAERFADSQTVEKLIAFAARPYVMKAWPCGPDDAKGKPFSALDTGLLKWALGKDFDADMMWNVRRELERRGVKVAA